MSRILLVDDEAPILKSLQRLLRVAIGGLCLGDLTKGQWRLLTAQEVNALRSPCQVNIA